KSQNPKMTSIMTRVQVENLHSLGVRWVSVGCGSLWWGFPNLFGGEGMGWLQKTEITEWSCLVDGFLFSVA
ncbi:hypothetical protein B0H65DRAFT_436754, partial [Neurospora tetraspora]